MDPVHQQVEDAKQVLYNLDPVDGSIISKSKLYEMYEKNAADVRQGQIGLRRGVCESAF